MPSLALTKLSETDTTITLGWSPPAGVAGYRFTAEKQAKPSHTWDPSRSSAKFSKGSSWYRVEALGVSVIGSYSASSPPPPPPPPGGTKTLPANGVITSGGVYSGTWEGSGQIVIDTEQAVKILGATLRKSGGGTMIRGLGGGLTIRNLTLDHCFIYGSSGWLFDAEGFEYMEIVNCTIDKTAGMKFVIGRPSSAIKVLRNKQKNLIGPNIGGPSLNSFVKLANVQQAAIEIGWNEVINEYNKSEVEDIISCMRTAHMRCHDNYLQGQYAPNNGEGTSSYNAITLEGPDEFVQPPDPECFDNETRNNQLVSTMGGVSFPDDCHDNRSIGDRLIRSGYLPDGVTKIHIGYSGSVIRGASNSMKDSYTGFVNGAKHGWFRTDYEFTNGAGDPGSCVSVPGTVTQQMERDEFTRWQQKLQANGITIGA